jgi:hypothetical protein
MTCAGSDSAFDMRMTLSRLSFIREPSVVVTGEYTASAPGRPIGPGTE